MKSIPIFWLVTLAVMLAPWQAQAQGEDAPRISELSYLDRQYMSQQRDSIDDLTRRYYGTGLNRQRYHDLPLLQRLLDDRHITPDQTQQLQAMGIVMGDVLAADLGLHWVIYEDKVGRTRALRYGETEEYLFPVTMISRRQEADNRKSVNDIYQKAYDIMKDAKPALPFQ